MPKLFKNRVFSIIFITLLLLATILLSSVPGSPLGFLSSPVTAVLRPVQTAVTSVVDWTGDLFRSISEGSAIQDENDKLAEENALLRSQIAQLEEAGRQYENLKAAFGLKDRFEEYEILGSRIMTREIGYWFDTFRIDVGFTDGILVSETESYAVVDAASHLVGRVLSQDLTSAKVLPLLHEGFAVSARTDKISSPIFRVRGDLDLKQQGLCLIDQIPSDTDLKVGDAVVTSGSGGLFPAGITIGTVVDVIDNDLQTGRQAYLQPAADLETLATVFVMKGIS